MLSDEQGRKLLQLARHAIDSHFSGQKPNVPQDDFFKEKHGVFVTLKKDGRLRGCIGFPEPVLPLDKAIVQAARAAAFGDPRFHPLEKGDEFDVELSILTKPELMDVPKTEMVGEIKVGSDGLVVRSPLTSGLLLPQVALEQGWNAEEFLVHTCLKAGLPSDAWLKQEVKVFKFQCQIFHER